MEMKAPSPTLSFVNHASVLIEFGGIGILSDPWYSGDAFHKGWKLIHENSREHVLALFNRTTHIWISHEHPDHFSVGFFKQYGQVIRERGIEVLYQQTKDRRIFTFLDKSGFQVRELMNREVVSLGDNYSIRLAKDEFYDSALIIDVDVMSVFNLNDCSINNPARAQRFAKEFGPCDVLLTQFSYAAWKGGPANKSWRQTAAQEKLDIVVEQAEALAAKVVVPFASYVYFSHELNQYLNDSVNRPGDVAASLADRDIKCVVLSPNETQSLDSLEQDETSLRFWSNQYAHIGERPGLSYDTSVSSDELASSFKLYVARVTKHNSKWFMKAVRAFSPIGVLKPIRIRLFDLGETFIVDPVLGGFCSTEGNADLEMHSESLRFIFQNAFGFDTLTVNGCFEECSPGGFSRASRTLAIENLNNLGIRFAPGILLEIDLILVFIKRLWKVSLKLKQPSLKAGES